MDNENKNQNEQDFQQTSQNLENAKNILAASMMAQSLNCCLEKNYLDSLSLANPIIEIVNSMSQLANSYTPISWLKIDQVGKPRISSNSSCFFYIQKILQSCAIPNRRLTFLVVGNGIKNSLYLGLRDLESSQTTKVRKEVNKLQNFSKGCWDGLITHKIDEEDNELREYFKKRYTQVTAFTGIPTVSDAKDNSVTTIEQIIRGMEGENFAYLVTADPVGSDRIDDLLMQCREIASQLESAKAINISEQVQQNMTESFSETLSYFNSWSETESESISKRDYKTLAGGALLGAGLATAAAFLFPPALALLPGAQSIISGTLASSAPFATFLGLSGMSGMQTVAGFVPQKTKGKSSSKTEGESHSSTEGLSFSKGSSESISKTLINKHVEAACRQLISYEKRYESAKATGAWNVSCYLFTENKNSATSWQLKSLLSGEESSLEPIRLHDITKILSDNEESVVGTAKTFPLMIKYTGNNSQYFTHPFGTDFSQMTTLLTTRELSALINFPLHSVPGLPVIEHASLAKEVVYYKQSNQSEFDLGCIFDYGLEYPKSRVRLRKNSMTQHVFVTGSTGCGKSETVYKIIEEARLSGAKFLIIEPAKGEYKNALGDATVLGTNPHITRLLRINPFAFPTNGSAIHVLEHVDRLVEIFNVCWPMYAAMPAVLKKAVLSCYKKCGWDMVKSENNNSGNIIFPNFYDLERELKEVIEETSYSEEVKNNYIGSLLTRVESLTNGINGEILNTTDVGDEILFNSNVIVDLSRIGSQETKSLIMGLLIMRLSEYRMAEAKEANKSLQHITVLEEAHNILKRTSPNQSMDGNNVIGKSVEMITNAIAEMRTYGESFVIVDQSPTSVAPAAIKNTNTKIIMRLPDGDDRRIAGQAASLTNEQIDEIAKLPTGVAVVYQNDWIAPVLCKVDISNGKRSHFKPFDETKSFDNSKTVLLETLKMLLYARVNPPFETDPEFVNKNIDKCALSTTTKQKIIELSNNNTKLDELQMDKNFTSLSRLVTDVLALRSETEQIVKKVSNFNELNELLDRLIFEKVPKLNNSTNFRRAICQCLMMDFGCKNSSNKKIYDAYLQTLKNK